MGVKMCWIQGLCSVNIQWGFARPIRANGAHPSRIMDGSFILVSTVSHACVSHTKELSLIFTAMHIITSLLCDFGDVTYPMDELIEQISNAKFEDTPLLLGRLYRHRGLYPEAEKVLEEHLRECDGHRKDSMRKQRFVDSTRTGHVTSRNGEIL